MRIIGIEGSSSAGKTTLANTLGSYFDAPIIEEYATYAQPEGFPSFATNENELDEQIQYYVALEAKRARDLRETSKVSDTVIVDRTASSLVAFQKAMSEDVSGAGFVWSADAMRYAVLEQKEAGLVINPDIVLVLSAGSQTEHERRVLERGPIATIPSLNNWAFWRRLGSIQKNHSLLWGH